MGNVPPQHGSSWPAAPQGAEGQAPEAYAQEQSWAGPPGGGRLTPPGGQSMVNSDPSVWAWPPPRPVRTSEFACAELPEGEPYHRLARNSRFRWWVPPLSLAVFAALAFFLWIGIALAMTIVAVAGGSGLAPDSVRVGEIAGLAFGLITTALFIPIVLFVVRVVQWRRVGSLMSVTGRVRWRWLARCAAVAVVPVALCVALFLPLSQRLQPELVPTDASGGTEVVAAALIVVVLLVPFQSAAEEITLRGLVMQLVGSLGAAEGGRRGGAAVARVLRSPGVAILAGGTLFAAIYGSAQSASGWTTAALAVTGLGMAWLTWHTGGLEAAIGLHVVNSLVQYTLCVFEGRMSEIGTGAVIGGLSLGSGTPVGLGLTMVQTGLYALAVAWLARRAGVRRTSPVAA